MLFKKILVALDGSSNSQIAAEHAFWLASRLGAELAGQHVVDPRLVDLFLEPAFAEELGFGPSVDASEKIFSALKKIGNVILELFATEAAGRGLKSTVFLDEGHVSDEILKYADEFDLLIMGHRGRTQHKLPAHLILGSTAERIVANSKMPILIAHQNPAAIKQIVVAYDCSEPARGALLLAEQLAKETACALKAVTVATATGGMEEARSLAADAQGFLRENWNQEVFVLKEGAAANVIVDYAKPGDSLLVLGAYGYRDPEQNVLGSTTTQVIRKIKTSVLIYRPKSRKANRKPEEQMIRLTAPLS